jgi:hypothetical protein
MTPIRKRTMSLRRRPRRVQVRIDDREIHDPFPLRIRRVLRVIGSSVGRNVRLRRRRRVIVTIWGVGHRREHRMMHFSCCG